MHYHVFFLPFCHASGKQKLDIDTVKSGPGCSKLTTSLVNETLKFQMLISQICQYFLLKKCEKLAKLLSFFSTKNFSVFGYKVLKHLTS